jgi:hypothetical protein
MAEHRGGSAVGGSDFADEVLVLDGDGFAGKTSGSNVWAPVEEAAHQIFGDAAPTVIVVGTELADRVRNSREKVAFYAAVKAGAVVFPPAGTRDGTSQFLGKISADERVTVILHPHVERPPLRCARMAVPLANGWMPLDATWEG